MKITNYTSSLFDAPNRPHLPQWPNFSSDLGKRAMKSEMDASQGQNGMADFVTKTAGAISQLQRKDFIDILGQTDRQDSLLDTRYTSLLPGCGIPERGSLG